MKPGSEKYEYARKHREIKTVSIEWHEQSLDRGMILEEALYHPLLPVEERGRGALTRRVTPTTSLGKRERENDGGSQNARKLRRTASAKFETQNDSLWTDIVGAEVKVEKAKVGDWDESAQAVETTAALTKRPDPVDAKVKTPRAEEESKPLKRSQSLGSLEPLLGKPAQSGPLFHGKTFLLQGFDEKKTAILVQHLQSHGAHLISDPSELPSSNAYLLVPHTISKYNAQRLVETRHQPHLVTDLWIERCMHRKHCVKPHENVTSTPFEQVPITGFKGLNVSSTGFQGVDLLHASKVVNLMGGNYYEYFTEKSSVLVCNNVAPGQEKLSHAHLWSVPAVNADWLWDCIREGQMLPYNDYLVEPTDARNLVNSDSTSTKKVEKPAVTRTGDAKPAAKGKSTEKPSKKPTSSSKEQLRHHKREPREPKPFGSPGESTANLFPDDAGPFLEDDPPQERVRENILAHDPNKTRNDSLGGRSKPSRPLPLHEITPNSSPPKPPAPEMMQPKAISPIKAATEVQDNVRNDTLGPAISSLLSHHQQARSSNPPTTKADSAAKPSSNPEQPLRRRRRQLLGRAPSNISSHSINPSRASSVDTMNTDGLGTPLEVSHSHGPSNTTNKGKKSELKAIYDTNHDDPDRPQEDHLQMTQLGYEDPDVAAWRERVAFKMGGGKVKAGTTPGKKAEGAKAKGNAEGLGISKRTRLATGGR